MENTLKVAEVVETGRAHYKEFSHFKGNPRSKYSPLKKKSPTRRRSQFGKDNGTIVNANVAEVSFAPNCNSGFLHQIEKNTIFIKMREYCKNGSLAIARLA